MTQQDTGWRWIFHPKSIVKMIILSWLIGILTQWGMNGHWMDLMFYSLFGVSWLPILLFPVLIPIVPIVIYILK